MNILVGQRDGSAIWFSLLSWRAVHWGTASPTPHPTPPHPTTLSPHSGDWYSSGAGLSRPKTHRVNLKWQRVALVQSAEGGAFLARGQVQIDVTETKISGFTFVLLSETTHDKYCDSVVYVSMTEGVDGNTKLIVTVDQLFVAWTSVNRTGKGPFI